MNNPNNDNNTVLPESEVAPSSQTETPLAGSTQPLGTSVNNQSNPDNHPDNTQNQAASHLTDAARVADNDTTQVGSIELLEERAVVNKERVNTGKLTMRKEQRTRTVNVPVELTEEVLVIHTEYVDSDSKQLLLNDSNDDNVIRFIEPQSKTTPSITVDGKDIHLGQEPVEIVLSREVATIQKETYAVQDINISKSTHTHSEKFDVELAHEELDVDESNIDETTFHNQHNPITK